MVLQGRCIKRCIKRQDDQEQVYYRAQNLADEIEGIQLGIGREPMVCVLPE